MTTSIPGSRAFLSVHEAAEFLNISPGLIYQLVHEFLATEGESGLPAVKLGRRLLVRRSGIEQLLGPDDVA
jgi:excisionase family DNA binding protein